MLSAPEALHHVVILSEGRRSNATESESKDPDTASFFHADSGCSHKSAWVELPQSASSQPACSRSFDSGSLRSSARSRSG
jgi:hypothetical protein